MEKKAGIRSNICKRPDLLKNVKLTKEDDRLLQEFITELEAKEDE